jgi:hypothetical protein
VFSLLFASYVALNKIVREPSICINVSVGGWRKTIKGLEGSHLQNDNWCQFGLPSLLELPEINKKRYFAAAFETYACVFYVYYQFRFSLTFLYCDLLVGSTYSEAWNVQYHSLYFCQLRLQWHATRMPSCFSGKNDYRR